MHLIQSSIIIDHYTGEISDQRPSNCDMLGKVFIDVCKMDCGKVLGLTKKSFQKRFSFGEIFRNVPDH